MNGDTNGNMDDPLESSKPTTSIDENVEKTISEADVELSDSKISDNGQQKPQTTKIGKDVAPDLDKTESGQPIPEVNKKDPKNYVEGSDTKKAETDPVVPQHENTNSPHDEKINNSNDSGSESVTNAKHKSKSNGQTDKEVDMTKKKKINHVELDEEYSQDIQDSEIDSEANSSEDEDSEGSVQKAVDTVSIHSESEQDLLSDDDDTNQKSDIIFVNSCKLDKKNGLNNLGSPSVIHEIESDNEDDCVVTSEERPNSSKSKSNVNNGKVETLRRSSRALKRKSYHDDVELVAVDNSKVKNKNKASFMTQVKSFIQQNAKRNKKIDIKSPKPAPLGKMNQPIIVEDLYQSIAARGTTVTPIVRTAAAAKVVASAKGTTALKGCGATTGAAAAPALATLTIVPTATATDTTRTTTRTTTPPPVLPSLTDDMFVVEAPSFVVPYVYEKPSVKDFRQFVDNLGKQLDEEKAKEERERLEKQKLEKGITAEGTVRGNESGEGTEKSEKIDASPSEDKNKKKGRNRRKKNDDDDASWDGSGDDSVESDDENISDEEKRVVIKDVDNYEVKDVLNCSTNKVPPAKNDSYFDCSLGKFFMDIGLSQVQEYVQVDLLKLHTRKLNREKKSGNRSRETEVVVASLMKNIELSRKNNEQYTYKQKKCQFCSFQTESALVMSNHFETPHMKNGLYKCNFCPVELRTPQDIMIHVEIQHKIKGKLEKAPGNHQCVNCPFEDNGKGKLARHIISCAKKFKPEINLSPPIEWEPPAKIPKIAKSRGNVMGGFAGGFKGVPMNSNVVRPPANPSHGTPLTAFKQRPQLSLSALPSRPALLSRPNVVVRHLPSIPVNQQGKPKPANQQPSLSITPLPQAPQFAQPQLPPQGKGTFVICEICDGYIKDLEQLRNHMQWIHKVKIHPKMIYNRPPLNCQKCQFRFFTDQGLERHLLGSHGLVTSSMQEAANKGKDAGRCPVCGRVYQWNLLRHVAKDHLLTLKPAHLSYKCTVCTATFGMYKQFENHVYSAHRVVAKRVMDKSKPTPAAKGAADGPPDSGKANDAATITPQPAKPATVTSQSK